MDLHLFGQPFGCMGIPNHTRDLFYHMAKANDGANIYPLFPAGARDRYDIDRVESMIKPWPTEKISGLVFVFWGPDVYEKILETTDRKNTIAVGYLVFEWTKFTDKYYEDAMKMDYLAVPSEWHKNILIENGIPSNKIYILKAGISDVFKDFKYDIIYDKPCDILFVGKFEKRKCVLELIEAYNMYRKTRTGTGFTSLSIDYLISDPHDPKFNAKSLPGIMDTGVTPKPGVRILDPVKTPQDMAALYYKYKYIIVPSRSGGIELPLIEAMSMGCRPIVTTVSGMQCYAQEVYKDLNDSPAWIGHKKMVPIYDNRWFPPTIDWGEWADVTVNDIYQALIHVTASDYDNSRAYLSRLKALELFDYDKIAKGFVSWLVLVKEQSHK